MTAAATGAEKPTLALVDYGAGNLTSVRKALEHLGAAFRTPAEPAELTSCAGIIVPGVGNFEATGALDPDWTEAVKAVLARGRPLLGICLGLQWLFDGSDESPALAGLGAMSGVCTRLPRTAPCGARLKVPHVGWNGLHHARSSWLLDGVREGDQVYFTHSYAAPVTDDCVAATTYGRTFASAVERDNAAGVQFHPEKSGEVGLQVLRNFLGRVDRVSRAR